jgi:hypothetical protein
MGSAFFRSVLHGTSECSGGWTNNQCNVLLDITYPMLVVGVARDAVWLMTGNGWKPWRGPWRCTWIVMKLKTIQCQQDRKRDPTGRKDLYCSFAISTLPWTMHRKRSPWNCLTSQLELAQSHFQMLAGVCAELCVVKKRLDMLFYVAWTHL